METGVALGTVVTGLVQTLLQRFVVAAVAGTQGEPVDEEPPTRCDSAGRAGMYNAMKSWKHH